MEGIEPPYAVLETAALPLSYTRSASAGCSDGSTEDTAVRLVPPPGVEPGSARPQRAALAIELRKVCAVPVSTGRGTAPHFGLRAAEFLPSAVPPPCPPSSVAVHGQPSAEYRALPIGFEPTPPRSTGGCSNH